MLKMNDLFQEEQYEIRTPKPRRNCPGLRRNVIHAPRDHRRHRPQRNFDAGRRNLGAQNTPYLFSRCERKLKFINQRDAAKSADCYMDGVCMTFDPMVPYHCRIHSKWHIGHDTRFPKERRVAYHEKCASRNRDRQAGI